MRAVMSLIAAAALLVAAQAARACGACIEDKIAATYDHGVVQQAAARGRVVVFCAIDGPFDARRIKASVANVRGVDAASLRSSAQPGALSFAIDPARQTPQRAVDALQRSVPAGTRLVVVKLVAPGR